MEVTHCRNCGVALHPAYVEKYHGYCLVCSNAGVDEKDNEIDALRAKLATAEAEAEQLAKACERLLARFGPGWPGGGRPGSLIREETDEARAALTAYRSGNPPAPIPMVLHCPKCGEQHVDAPEPEAGWHNPPHRSHKCHYCGTIWRPADVPTNGGQAVATRGSADTWSPGKKEGT